MAVHDPEDYRVKRGLWRKKGSFDVSTQPGYSRQADDAAIRVVEAAYDTAWNAGDLASLLKLLTDSIVIVNPYGETAIGRDAIETTFTALFDGVARGSIHTSQIRAIHFVTPDVALVDAEAVIAGFGPGSEPLRHDFTDVLVRTRESWQIDQVRAYSFLSRPQA